MGVVLEFTPVAEEKIAELGYDPQFGARPLKRVLQRTVVNELSRQVLAGSVDKDSVILVDLGPEGEFIFENASAPANI